MSAEQRTAIPLAAPSPDNRLGIFVAQATVYIVWGSTYLGIKFAIATIPPFLMNGSRFLVAAVILFLYARLRGTRIPSLREAGSAALVGILMLGIGVGGTGLAEQHVRSGLAAVVVASVPLWAALFSGFWGRWPNRIECAGLLVGIVGVGMLNLDGGLSGNPLYALVVLLAAASFALGSVWGTHLPLPQGSMATAFEMLGGGVLLTVAGLATESTTIHPDLHSTLAWIYLVVVGSLIAYSAFVYLLSRVRPATATTYAYVNPVIAVVLGALFAGERVTTIEVVAMLIIISGVGLVLAGRDRTLHAPVDRRPLTRFPFKNPS
jgi:drug/metabolite transporter (DMT)-like permease